jgi:hypothetical protein
MARVRGIEVDSQYLVTCDVVERAEFELRVMFGLWWAQETHLRRMGSIVL